MTDATRRRLNLFSYLYLYSLKSSDKHLHDRHGKKTTELVVAKNYLGELRRCHLMIKTGDFDFVQIQKKLRSRVASVNYGEGGGEFDKVYKVINLPPKIITFPQN